MFILTEKLKYIYINEDHCSKCVVPYIFHQECIRNVRDLPNVEVILLLEKEVFFERTIDF